MTPALISGAVASLLASCVAYDRLRAAHNSRRRLAAIAELRSIDTAARADYLRSIISSDPANHLAWYLRGCEAFRARDHGSAARYFGMAHHLDPDLLSAALLTFTALKSASPDARGDEIAWLRELVATWREMNLSHNGFERTDRVVWQFALQPHEIPDDLSELGRLAWLVAPQSPYSAVREIRSARPAWAADLFRQAGS